jgi:hypothetical protein
MPCPAYPPLFHHSNYTWHPKKTSTYQAETRRYDTEVASLRSDRFQSFKSHIFRNMMFVKESKSIPVTGP